MARRPAARELELDAARLPPAPSRRRITASEPLAMLVRRGLDPRPTRPDLPFDPLLPAERLDERRPRSRYRLLTRARTFGGTLEWWLARELAARLGLDVATGVRSGARGVGGDLDLVAAAEGKLVYAELKSGPPKHLTGTEVGAFLRRLRAVRPDVALFVVDTALRLGDKVVPMLATALSGDGVTRAAPRRVARDTWALTPHVYVVSAKEDLVENACRAIAEGLRALAPHPP